MKLLNKIAYFIGYYRRRTLNALKFVSILVLACAAIYAVIHFSGLTVEIKKADLVLWQIS